MHNLADNSTATYVIILLMTVSTIACNYCYADIQTPPHDLLLVQTCLSNMHMIRNVLLCTYTLVTFWFLGVVQTVGWVLIV